MLNTGKSFPVDYLLKAPKKYIIDPTAVTSERIKRMVIFKLAVMRRIQEIRIKNSKPKLSDLLKELRKGGPVQRMEVKRKILALYEFDEKEKEEQLKEKKENQTQMTKEDMNEKNQTFLKLKLNMKKILDELHLQEEHLNEINEKMRQNKP